VAGAGARLSAQHDGRAAGGTAAAAADLVELGRLCGAYGVRGWSHVQPYSGEASILRSARQWWLLPPQGEIRGGASGVPVQVSGVRTQGTGLVAKWRGCEDPEAAHSFRGWRIAVARSAFPPLPDGQYYWVDLIGAHVINRSGQVLGVVRGLRNNGAQDLLEVEPAVAKQKASDPILIPMVDAYIDAIDLAAKRICVDWQAQW